MVTTVELRAYADNRDVELLDNERAMLRDAADVIEDLAKHIDGSVRVAAEALARVKELEGELADEKMEHNELAELLSRPEIDDFQDGLVLEAAHQRQRWGNAHDRSKSAENWYWLVGYLAGKALRAAIEGNQNKARHHTISTAAALFQWHKAIGTSPNGVGSDDDLKPPEQPTRPLEDILAEAERGPSQARPE